VSERYLVPETARRLRADKVLAAAFPMHSRSAIQRAFGAGLVLRKGVAIGQSDAISAGDVIEFSLPEVQPTEMLANPLPLDVIFEDADVIAINKAAGMVVHPGAGTGGNTLVHALLSHCAGSLSGVGGVERPGIVHRLDRDTSGIILVAKNDGAHRALAEQFSKRTLVKEYLALIAGAPALTSGSIRKAIGRDPRHRHRMTVFEPGAGGRAARTDWTVIERFDKRAALLRCALHTGRTHQIRVHLKSLGHPILGDTVYGFKKSESLPAAGRVMLHAERLRFTHPTNQKPLDLRAPLPSDFVEALDALRSARG
jgi:23S rRNA pseudouridine1911/1915/1917 synthase